MSCHHDGRKSATPVSRDLSNLQSFVQILCVSGYVSDRDQLDLRLMFTNGFERWKQRVESSETVFLNPTWMPHTWCFISNMDGLLEELPWGLAQRQAFKVALLREMEEIHNRTRIEQPWLRWCRA